MILKFGSLILFCLSIFLNPADEPKNDKCDLSLELSNIRNNKGLIHFFVYNYKNQYPDNPFQHFSYEKKNIVNGQMQVNIKDLDRGLYAFSLVDDENANEDLDFFLGIPLEGYGFSNDIRPLFSMPNFEDLLIEVSNENKKVKINLQYIF